jgi:type I restriction enzyme, S subunit
VTDLSSPLPPSWISAELSELTAVHYGKALAAGIRVPVGQVPVIGSSGVVGQHDEALVDGPCLVIGRKGAAGSVHLVRESSWPIDTAYFVQPPPDIDLLYLSHLLGISELGSLDKSTAIPSLSRDDLYRVLVPVAPRAEQTRIVAKLEELLTDLDAGVAELKAAQKKLGQYRQSLLKAAVEGALTAEWRATHKPTDTGAQLLQRILTERRARWEAKQLAKFKEQGKTPPKDWQKKYPEPVQPDTTDLPELPEGWVWASVDQIAEVFLGKMLDKTKHTSGERLPYLRNVNVRWGSIDLDDVYEMFFDADELERYGLLAGDVLVCEGGEPGRAAICKKEHERFKYQKALHRVRLFSMYEPELLIAFLEFIAKTGRLAKTFTGSTINHFTKESFLALQVPVPSLAEQRVIVESISLAMVSIDDQETAITITFKQSTAQRQNILRAAFAGELVPQDPNDERASVLLERIRAERVVVKKPRGRQAKETA